ncbi:hypothetical protein JCM9140_1569 [Halalkalibacter wakoensis JCM 9140]|uniref:Uncharacterized protein n=1 Tax=Halalkalibacter wakoensis JCM 9140 TaxID=1236970 RepID=W4Q2I1_9BACI|nr:hypothetical protein [Halalkalibacter wakoensis]GAE25569.1 hypothetical protein JCM9140_1569 [Halalkalibacter wakoensis JCM 9140]
MKIVEHVTPEDMLEIVPEVVQVQERRFNWFLFYSKGLLKLEDEKGDVEELRGLNVAGFWFEY